MAKIITDLLLKIANSEDILFNIGIFVIVVLLLLSLLWLAIFVYFLNHQKKLFNKDIELLKKDIEVQKEKNDKNSSKIKELENKNEENKDEIYELKMKISSFDYIKDIKSKIDDLK